MSLRSYPFAFALTAILIGCGANGPITNQPPYVGAPTPKPAVTPTPKATPVTYSIKIKFISGGTSLATQARTVHGRTVRTVYSHVLDSGTTVNGQVPIEVTVLPTPQSQLAQDGGEYGEAEVLVAPSPSTPPAITAMATGAPIDTGAIANDPGYYTVTAASTIPVSGSFVADLSGSVVGSATTPVYQIQQTLVACGNMPVYGTNNLANSYDQIGSLNFSGGVGTAVSGTSADFYVDGPNCSTVGNVNSDETEATLHFPYGATLVSSINTPFSELAASQYTVTFTSITFNDLVSDFQETSTPPNELLVQTGSGAVVKIAPLSLATQGDQSLVYMDFAYAQTGFSVDGF